MRSVISRNTVVSAATRGGRLLLRIRPRQVVARWSPSTHFSSSPSLSSFSSSPFTGSGPTFSSLSPSIYQNLHKRQSAQPDPQERQRRWIGSSTVTRDEVSDADTKEETSSGGKTVPINIIKGGTDPETVSEADRPEWLSLKHLGKEMASFEDLQKRFNEDEDSLSYEEFKRLWRLANVRKIKGQNADKSN